jgi:hypothetical protein
MDFDEEKLPGAAEISIAGRRLPIGDIFGCLCPLAACIGAGPSKECEAGSHELNRLLL